MAQNRRVSMKKILLVCALICVGQLYGMEKEQKQENWNLLPREVQVLVIQALNSGNTLDEVIKSIKSLSLVNKELNSIVNETYGNLEQFTALVHLLAKKFKNEPNTYRQG